MDLNGMRNARSYGDKGTLSVLSSLLYVLH